MAGNVNLQYEQNTISMPNDNRGYNQKLTTASVVQKRGGSPNNLIMNNDYGNNFGPVEANSGLSGVQLMNKNQRGNTTNFFQTKGATIYNKGQQQVMNNTAYGQGFGPGVQTKNPNYQQ